MAKYFDKYPIIFYGNHYARNLMARAKLSDTTKSNIRLFYPYQTKEEEMFPDIIADKYYKDPYYDWLIGLCNDIVDPYYDYAIDVLSFNRFIVAKYGSLAAANSKILYYKNNWETDDSIITVSTYDGLAVNLKKYWTASLDYTGAVAGYTRKQEDWVLQTNRIVEIAKPVGVSLGDVYSNGGATGTVCAIGDTTIQICNVTGTFPGQTLLSESLADTESAYWEPVFAYQHELDLNESKRKIRLIDNRYVFDVEQELAKALK